MELLTNEPKPILVVELPDPRDSTIRRPKTLHARALPMRAAMEWLADAEQIEAGLNGAPAPKPVIRGGEQLKPFNKGDIPGAGFDTQPDALQALAAFVAAYDKTWPVEAIIEQATGPQLVNAFYALKELNDPLAVVRARQQAEQERGLRMFEMMAKAAPEAAARLVEQHSGVTSARSAESSE